jgi:hypothetical protein
MKLKDIIKDLKLGKIYTDKDRPPFKVNESANPIKVKKAVDVMIKELRKMGRKLNDDEFYNVTVELKKWFNKNVM